MRRTAVLATALTATVLGAGSASAAGGTGVVVDTLAATVVPGLLTIAGVGVNVSAQSEPGQFGEAVGATVITVSDLTLSDAGWRVTATYDAPVAPAKALGGSNVQVSATGLTGDLAGTAVELATDAPLTTPVTVATTGTAAGTGVTAFTAKYKVRLPETAKAGEVYGGTVTYTVATVR